MTLSDIYYGRIEHPWALDIEHGAKQISKELEPQRYEDSLEQHVAYIH